MKTILVSFILWMALAFAASAADISGAWSGSFVPEGGDNGTAYVVLKQRGGTITGSGGPDANEQWPGLTGSVEGNNVSLEVKSAADGTVYKCTLVLDGKHLKGEVTFTTTDGQSGRAKLDLARVPE